MSEQLETIPPTPTKPLKRLKRSQYSTFHHVHLYLDDYYRIIELLSNDKAKLYITTDEFEIEEPSQIESVISPVRDLRIARYNPEVSIKLKGRYCTVEADNDDPHTLGLFHAVCDIAKQRENRASTAVWVLIIAILGSITIPPLLRIPANLSWIGAVVGVGTTSLGTFIHTRLDISRSLLVLDRSANKATARRRITDDIWTDTTKKIISGALLFAAGLFGNQLWQWIKQLFNIR